MAKRRPRAGEVWYDPAANQLLLICPPLLGYVMAQPRVGCARWFRGGWPTTAVYVGRAGLTDG
jgi:hypothetical protein